MAIGDAVAVLLGTATTNRQPASGVAEQITSLAKSGATDGLAYYDGSSARNWLEASGTTCRQVSDSAAPPFSYYEQNSMITNAEYARKSGTTDRVYVGGVQTNT